MEVAGRTFSTNTLAEDHKARSKLRSLELIFAKENSFAKMDLSVCSTAISLVLTVLSQSETHLRSIERYFQSAPTTTR